LADSPVPGARPGSRRHSERPTAQAAGAPDAWTSPTHNRFAHADTVAPAVAPRPGGQYPATQYPGAGYPAGQHPGPGSQLPGDGYPGTRFPGDGYSGEEYPGARPASAGRSGPSPRRGRPVERGLPSWLAMVVLLVIAGIGGLIDIGSGSNVRGGFNYGLVIASAAAILLVRRRGMFPIVIAPPIVYFVASGGMLYLRSGGLHNHKVLIDAAANWRF
jgi:hypothetical protein